jgi:hypothetical protein
LKLPDDVRQWLARRFGSKHREWLAATDSDERWPLTIGLGLPTEQAAMRQPDAVRSWAASWREWRGPGEVRWTDRQWPALGAQRLPESVILKGPAEVAVWISQEQRWAVATQRYAALATRWAAPQPRLAKLFDVLADYSDADFDRLISIVEWIAAHPRSNLYPRQLPIAGVDSKWLESRKGTIVELVGQRIGADPTTDFYALCGLKRPPVLVRIRILDRDLRRRLGGLGDLSAPVSELVQLELTPNTVLIVENLQSGLALEEFPGAVAVMALGYGVDQLSTIPWITNARCLYWGDIDTHGFAILSRARRFLPQLTSMLMDEATLLRFPDLWTTERAQVTGATPEGLTLEEQYVYEGLRQGQWGPNVRLEQERLSWDYVAREFARRSAELR